MFLGITFAANSFFIPLMSAVSVTSVSASGRFTVPSVLTVSGLLEVHIIGFDVFVAVGRTMSVVMTEGTKRELISPFVIRFFISVWFRVPDTFAPLYTTPSNPPTVMSPMLSLPQSILWSIRPFL